MESGLGGGGGGGCCVGVFVCDVWRGSIHVCVHLWELHRAFYAGRPGRNIANIAVKGDLDAARVMQIIDFKGFFYMRTDENQSKYVAIEHLGGVAHLVERQRRAFDNGGGGKKKKKLGDIGKMDPAVVKPTVPESCFTF